MYNILSTHNYSNRENVRNRYNNPLFTPTRVSRFNENLYNTYVRNFRHPSPPAEFNDVVIRPTLDEIINATSRKLFANIDNPLNYTCPISHFEFTSDSDVIQLNHCKHIFNPTHIMQWFQSSVHCPLCRHDIRLSNAQNISPENGDNLDNLDNQHNADNGDNLDNQDNRDNPDNPDNHDNRDNQDNRDNPDNPDYRQHHAYLDSGSNSITGNYINEQYIPDENDIYNNRNRSSRYSYSQDYDYDYDRPRNLRRRFNTYRQYRDYNSQRTNRATSSYFDRRYGEAATISTDRLPQYLSDLIRRQVNNTSELSSNLTLELQFEPLERR